MLIPSVYLAASEAAPSLEAVPALEAAPLAAQEASLWGGSLAFFFSSILPVG